MNLFAWGANEFGQLGDGTTTSRNVPVQVAMPSGVPSSVDVGKVAAGRAYTLLLFNGRVWACGDNANGELGDGTTTNRTRPVPVLGPGGSGFLTDVTAIACGGNHSLALRSDGTVWAWGDNSSGQLGDGTN